MRTTSSRGRSLALTLATTLGLALGCSSTGPASGPATTLPTSSTTGSTPGSTIAGPPAPGTTAPGTTPAAPPSTLISQEDVLLGAAQGRWTGEPGSIAFRPDGTAELQWRDCPEVPDGPRFGFSVDCAPTAATGRVSIGQYRLTVADETQRRVVAHTAYVDGAGHLHLGTGHTFDVTPQLTGALVVDDEEPVVVDADRCARIAGDGTRTAVACHWDLVDGLRVLTLGTDTYLYDESAGVATSPSAYYGVLGRS